MNKKCLNTQVLLYVTNHIVHLWHRSYDSQIVLLNNAGEHDHHLNKAKEKYWEIHTSQIYVHFLFSLWNDADNIV